MKLAAFHYTASGLNQVAAAPTVAEAYTVIEREGLRIHEVAEIKARDFDLWRRNRLNPSLEHIQLHYTSLGYANDGIKIPEAKDWKRVYAGQTVEVWASNSRRELYRISQ